MAKINYKSFGYRFDETKGIEHVGLTSEIYRKLDSIVDGADSYWLHFDKPSKNLQQQLVKHIAIPKPARLILFAEEVRSRCVNFETGSVLIVQGVQPSTMAGDDDFPTLRFWITKEGLVSFATGKIEAIKELQKELYSFSKVDHFKCLTRILDHMIDSLEESIYHLDEEMNKIEVQYEYTEETSHKILAVRQDLIFLRRYVYPQREALLTLASSRVFTSDHVQSLLKELSDGMIRQVEAIEMARERTAAIQDNITNQIGEIANRRMYLLTIIMLIFTPAFFVMGMFSMYLPIPGMNSKSTWWIILCGTLAMSFGLFFLFKKKKWL